MKLSRNGAKFIAHFEGFRSCPYPDVAGVWTIAYGHTKNVGPGSRCVTPAQGLALLQNDAGIAAAAVNEYVRVPLNQHQFDALVSFVYNVGVGAFASSTLLRKLNRHQKQTVPNQLMRWCLAGGSVVAGLAHRRRAEGRLYRRPWKKPPTRRTHR